MVWIAGPHGKRLDWLRSELDIRMNYTVAVSIMTGKGHSQRAGSKTARVREGNEKEITSSALVSKPTVTSYQLLASVSSAFPLQEMR